jgi:hypothetical protein
MLQLILMFGVGIYFGTYYNCKPHIEKIIKTIKNNMPESKGK